jgi:hypothetical protein
LLVTNGLGRIFPLSHSEELRKAYINYKKMEKNYAVHKYSYDDDDAIFHG